MHTLKHHRYHVAVSHRLVYNVCKRRWYSVKGPFSCFSSSLAEKEIPILVKQEPVEIKEPMIEADKFKSRYKKFIPPVLPSPVSWIVWSFMCHPSSQVNPVSLDDAFLVTEGVDGYGCSSSGGSGCVSGLW